MDQTLTEIVSRTFDQINPFSEKQGGLVNSFQNDDFLNDLLIIGFIVAYGLALQIAISGVFRKLFLLSLIDTKFANFNFLSISICNIE